MCLYLRRYQTLLERESRRLLKGMGKDEMKRPGEDTVRGWVTCGFSCLRWRRMPAYQHSRTSKRDFSDSGPECVWKRYFGIHWIHWIQFGAFGALPVNRNCHRTICTSLPSSLKSLHYYKIGITWSAHKQIMNLVVEVFKSLLNHKTELSPNFKQSADINKCSWVNLPCNMNSQCRQLEKSISSHQRMSSEASELLS